MNYARNELRAMLDLSAPPSSPVHAAAQLARTPAGRSALFALRQFFEACPDLTNQADRRTPDALADLLDAFRAGPTDARLAVSQALAKLPRCKACGDTEHAAGSRQCALALA